VSLRHSRGVSKTIKETVPLSKLCYLCTVKDKVVRVHATEACLGRGGRAPLAVWLGVWLWTGGSSTERSCLAQCWLFTKKPYLCIVGSLWRYAICALLVIYEDMLFAWRGAKWSVLLTQYYAGDKIEKNEKGWACGVNGWGEGVCVCIYIYYSTFVMFLLLLLIWLFPLSC